MCWPLAMWVGKKSQASRAGVPVYPVQRFIHNFPNIHPSRTIWRKFRRYAGMTLIGAGALACHNYMPTYHLQNQYYTRPDLKPKAAMVKGQNDYDDVVYQ